MHSFSTRKMTPPMQRWLSTTITRYSTPIRLRSSFQMVRCTHQRLASTLYRTATILRRRWFFRLRFPSSSVPAQTLSFICRQRWTRCVTSFKCHSPLRLVDLGLCRRTTFLLDESRNVKVTRTPRCTLYVVRGSSCTSKECARWVHGLHRLLRLYCVINRREECRH